MSAPVATESGLVTGVDGATGIRIFRGIPYGADTGGSRRWRPPEPALPWRGVRAADRFGPICAQNQKRTDYPMSEDCLSLNIWTPTVDETARLPVLVWIHGGRFIWGTGRDAAFDGTALAAQGMVVVTVNYRLGVFGFLATPELSAESGHNASGNYGLMDQLAALNWVQRNIAGFGGDPSRVTIAGQSAGAACVLDHLYSPHSAGTFHRAIVQSGAMHPRDPALDHVAAAYRQLDAAEEEGVRYLHEHGVDSIAALRTLPTDALLVGNDANEASEGPGRRPPLFRPVRDGWIFSRSYADALAAPAHNDVPVLTGTTAHEDGASPDADAATNAAANELSRTSTYLWARLRAQHAKSAVYRYFWTHRPPGPDGAARGAFHESEIPYFLDSLDRLDLPWTRADREIATMVSGYIARFVATGDPNGGGAPRWDATSADTAETMELGDAFRMIPVARSAAELDALTAWLERQPVPR